jgi:hypothetical protein
MFSTDVFTKATSSTSAKNDEQKTRVEIQASFTLESVSDGKQKFSLENLYIILPENTVSVAKQTNDTVTTPVKPVTKTIPSAPVKSYPKNVSSNAVKGDENNTCPCISCTYNRNPYDKEKQFYESEFVGLYKKYDNSITYEDFLQKRDSVTSKDKHYLLQIKDYLSAKVVEKRENDKRLCLLQKLFDENKYQWKDEYLHDYKKWSTKFDGTTNMNRYKKMVQFINENRSNFTKTI